MAARAAPYPVSEERPWRPPEASAARPPPRSVWRQLADFHSKDLNLLPTLALCVPIFLLFLSLSAFLEAYILSNASSFLGIFLVGSYIVFSSYFVANYYMAQMSSSYAAIPDDKKFYVLVRSPARTEGAGAHPL
jgi:hypothetical protein